MIGAIARTDWLPEALQRDAKGFILTGRDLPDWEEPRPPFLLETSVPGIFCAGDVRHDSIKRVSSDVGEGSMAIAFVHQYLAQRQRMTGVRRHWPPKQSSHNRSENGLCYLPERKDLRCASGRLRSCSAYCLRSMPSPLLGTAIAIALPASPPQSFDRGFRDGKVARSKVTGGSSSMYVANGQNETIRIYRSGMIRETAHKLTFDLFDKVAGSYIQKCHAYVCADIAGQLHRQHCYRVRFNRDPRHPMRS
jgi:hypothetical protein